MMSFFDVQSHKQRIQMYVGFVYIGNDRYDVYANLEAEAAFLKLNDSGVHLLQLQAAFAKLQVCLDIAFCPAQPESCHAAWF